ncbi:MAG: hypothetical protein HND48_11080 [Chloroflexi bacterium]|nr:hypothetical protein [Chloroflexota bacterium]
MTFTYVDELNDQGQIDTVLQKDVEVIRLGTDATLNGPASIVPGEDGWTVSVTDADLMGSTVDVLFTSSRGESETVTLTDQGRRRVQCDGRYLVDQLVRAGNWEQHH